MRYLNKREKFLQDLKQLNIEQLNESFDMSGQGPFGNDIPWGDSLVGRLVNAIRRKVGIGINMVRIQPVINRLKMEMENLKASATVFELSEEDKKKISMIIIAVQIRLLKLAIVNSASYGSDEDSEEMPEITDSNMTEIKPENYLKEVEGILTDVRSIIGETSDNYGEIDGYNDLMENLKDLAAFISFLKSEIKDSEEKGDEDKEDKDEEKSNINIESYIENFKSVANIVLEYDVMKKQKAEEFKSKSGSTSVKSGESSALKPEKEKDLIGSEVMDSFSYNEAAVVSPILPPLKKLYDTLKQISPEDLSSDMQQYLKMSLETQKSEKFANPVKNIYKYVRLKSGIKESFRINEDLNNLLSKDKVMGDVILGLYAVSKTKPDGSFEGITPKMKQHIAEFNKSMTQCLATKSTTEPTKEGKILKYTGFKQEYLINESKLNEFISKEWDKIKQFFADDNDIPEDENPSKVDSPENLRITKNNQKKLLTFYWEDMWNSKISKIIVTEQQYKKLREEVEKLEEPDSDSLMIGMDPIIGILKCFNRAYKLHTTNVIPGARSGGKVSRAVFNEYTCFGGGAGGSSSGELSGTSGPYRNNKIFNMWENAVLELMRDKENAKVFNIGTSVNLGGGKIKKEAGPALRRFMVDMLDGNTLYMGKGDFGKDAGGAQKELLNKYFDIPIDKVETKDLAFGGEKEVTNNTEIQSEIKTAVVQFKPGKSDDIKEAKNLKRMVFEIECQMEKPSDYKEEDKEIETKKRYFLPIESDADFLYVVYSRTSGDISKYIENDFAKREKPMSVSFEPSSLKTQPKVDIYLTKIRYRDFLSMIKPNGFIELKGRIHKTTDIKTIGKQKTLKVNFLYAKEGEEEPKVYNLEKYNFEGAKGFKIDELKTSCPESTPTR